MRLHMGFLKIGCPNYVVFLLVLQKGYPDKRSHTTHMGVFAILKVGRAWWLANVDP